MDKIDKYVIAFFISLAILVSLVFITGEPPQNTGMEAIPQAIIYYKVIGL